MNVTGPCEPFIGEGSQDYGASGFMMTTDGS
jgi:hypothetical protein